MLVLARWTLIFTFLVWLLIPMRVLADEAQDEAKVKEVVKSFLASVKDKDLDAILRAVDVPWLAEDQQITNERKGLKELWKRRLENSDLTRIKLEAYRVTECGPLFKEHADPALLQKVVGPEDWVVFVGNLEKRALRYVLVRGKDPAAKVVGGPYKATYLLMPNKVPEAAREAREKAERVELLSLEPPPLRDKPTDIFCRCKVLGKTTLMDQELRKKVTGELRKSIDESEGMYTYCFNPRHGLRITYAGRTVDFSICFECFQVGFYDGDDREQVFLITDSPQPVFDKALRDAGVPLAPKVVK